MGVGMGKSLDSQSVDRQTRRAPLATGARHAIGHAALALVLSLSSALMKNHAAAQSFAGGSLAAMVERAAPSVVNIAVVTQLAKPKSPLANDPVLGPLLPDAKYRFDTGGGVGSGVIIDAARGIVVTNHHVIDSARKITVILRDRRELEATLVGSDPATDIAVLRIAPDNLTAMPVANSDGVRIGNTVIAIGNPFGVGQTVTAGIVSALGRSTKMHGYEEHIQTDAAINPGNSGGALANSQGELVGINTSILTGGGRGSVGIGFAVPTNIMMAVVEQLLRHGEVRRGRAGLSGEDVTPGIAKTRGLSVTEGALITRVDSGSPAQKSGIQVGDAIIAVNGKSVTTQAALRNRLALTAVGESVELTYLRGGARGSARFEIAPIPPSVAKSGDVGIPQLPGVRMGDHPEGGVAVSTVDAKGASHEMGLRGGDIIDAVDMQPVPDLAGFRQIMEKAGFAILSIIRGDSKVLLRYRASY